MKTAFEASGEIRSIDLLAAFVTAWREAANGSLRFSRGAVSAGFDLAEGEIVAVFSSEPRFETAAILVRAGKLGAAALERLSVTAGSDAALAALQAGILTRREWKWGEKIRAIEVLADLLAWPGGEYLFDGDARPARGEFVLTLPRLLLELFLRSRDRHLIEHQLGSTDVPLARTANFDEEFATFGLTADAESVVQLIDGRTTASEITARAPAEEFAVLKLLAALKTLGLLAAGEPAGGPGPAAPDKEGQEPAPAEVLPLEPWAARQTPELGEPQPESGLPLAEIPLEESAGILPASGKENRDWDVPESEPSEAAKREEEASPWEETPVGGEWEEQARESDLPSPAPSEPALEAERPGRLWGLLLGTFFVLLVGAIAGTVILRSQRRSQVPLATTPPAPTAAPTALALSPASATMAQPPAALLAPTPAPARSVARSFVSTAAPAARPTPTRASRTVRAAPGDRRGIDWVDRARRDRRRLESEKKTRYAIQLELACETASLAEAWKHDQPAGSMWLLAASHEGRECFRVLWGRYGSLEEARRAKGAIPSYFVTATNRPAVVSVR